MATNLDPFPVTPPPAEHLSDHDFDDETPTPIVRTLTIEEQHRQWVKEMEVAEELGISSSERITRPIRKIPKP